MRFSFEFVEPPPLFYVYSNVVVYSWQKRFHHPVFPHFDQNRKMPNDFPKYLRSLKEFSLLHQIWSAAAYFPGGPQMFRAENRSWLQLIPSATEPATRTKLDRLFLYQPRRNPSHPTKGNVKIVCLLLKWKFCSQRNQVLETPACACLPKPTQCCIWLLAIKPNLQLHTCQENKHQENRDHFDFSGTKMTTRRCALIALEGSRSFAFSSERRAKPVRSTFIIRAQAKTASLSPRRKDCKHQGCDRDVVLEREKESGKRCRQAESGASTLSSKKADLIVSRTSQMYESRSRAFFICTKLLQSVTNCFIPPTQFC